MNAKTPMGFAELGLAESFTQALSRADIETPTPVQAQSIPAALQGNDLLVSSQTGSGKTLAFMLPSLQRLSDRPRSDIPQILVLTPTRELAQQVADVAIKFGGGQQGPKIVTLVGGAPYGPQLRMLRGRVDIVVATPGRLLDHLNSGRLNLSAIQTLILDEADRMLDMGFEEDLEAILACIPDERQTLLFSATLDGEVAHLAKEYTSDPTRIEIARTAEGQPQIEQLLFYANNQEHKQEILTSLLATFMEEESLQQGVIFTATKRSAEELSEILKEHGFNTKALHGDMNQGARTRALGGLRKGHTQLLIATDVAARGLDVSTISHVFNYDLPNQAENYVHRIGRTGRAGRAGLAISLAHVRERGRVMGIQRYTNQEMEECVIEGLEPTTPTRQKKPAHSKGRPHQNAPRGGFHPRDHQAHSTRSDRAPSRRRENDRFEERGARHARSEHSPRGEYREGGERHPRQDRPPRHDRAERTGFGEWQNRGPRQNRDPNAARQPHRGAEQGAPDRSERRTRSEPRDRDFQNRSHAGERTQRRDSDRRPAYGDRAQRSNTGGRPAQGVRADRNERSDQRAPRSDKPRSDKPRLSIDKGPRKGAGKAAIQNAGKRGGHQRPKRATRPNASR
jgi:superfamily II DNA/RNA helicase